MAVKKMRRLGISSAATLPTPNMSPGAAMRMPGGGMGMKRKAMAKMRRAERRSAGI